MLKQLIDKDRPVRDVPVSIISVLIISFFIQLAWHNHRGPLTAKAEDLPLPLSANTYRMASLGESTATSKILNLWLQAFDNQPGVSLSFKQLDYHRLTRWLDLILELDPRGNYPMLVAARVYGSVKDKARQRIMTEYIYNKFLEDPNAHWRWLAHATITAKHELEDPELALKYADALANDAKGDEIPYWVKDLKIPLLEDMGELEAAKVLVGGLIATGEIKDPYELNFLESKIKELEEKLSRN